jgi:hypothetical protein
VTAIHSPIVIRHQRLFSQCEERTRFLAIAHRPSGRGVAG